MFRLALLCSTGMLALLAAAPADDVVPAGTWGGPHIALEVTDRGARATFDCAHGTIDERLVIDREGRFDVRGSYAVEHPGPTRETEDDAGRAVRYAGRVRGTSMTLAISVAGASDPIGTFTLERGRSGAVHRCQ